MQSRVLVIGGGALGGVMAARLSRAGHDLTVLDARPDHVELMKDPGLKVNLVGEEFVIPVNAVSEIEDLQGPYDFGIVTLKAPHIESALTPLADRGMVDTYVSLGNGLVQDRILGIVGRERLIVGTVSWGATNHGPGHVSQTTIAPFSVGEIDGRGTPRLAALGEVLADVAEVHFTDNIQGQVWSKLLLNSTFSGLGVVTGLVYGDVVDLPGGEEVCMALWTEGYQVAMQLAIRLDRVAGIDPRDIAVLEPEDRPRSSDAIRTLMKSLGPTKASMLQDVEHRRISEVDVINGGVSAAGRQIGAATPLNDAVVAIVHGYESGNGEPDPISMNGLRALAEQWVQE